MKDTILFAGFGMIFGGYLGLLIGHLLFINFNLDFYFGGTIIGMIGSSLIGYNLPERWVEYFNKEK